MGGMGCKGRREFRKKPIATCSPNQMGTQPEWDSAELHGTTWANPEPCGTVRLYETVKINTEHPGTARDNTGRHGTFRKKAEHPGTPNFSGGGPGGKGSGGGGSNSCWERELDRECLHVWRPACPRIQAPGSLGRAGPEADHRNPLHKGGFKLHNFVDFGRPAWPPQAPGLAQRWLVRWVHEGSPLATRYPSSRDATVGTARMPPFLRSCP
eukprot:gene11317-biopygen6358